MISLTRLNNTSLIVNSDLIKFVEQSPDTVITLVNGEKILARETVDEIVQRIVQFRRSVVQNLLNPPQHGPFAPAADVEEHERLER